MHNLGFTAQLCEQSNPCVDKGRIERLKCVFSYTLSYMEGNLNTLWKKVASDYVKVTCTNHQCMPLLIHHLKVIVYDNATHILRVEFKSC